MEMATSIGLYGSLLFVYFLPLLPGDEREGDDIGQITHPGLPCFCIFASALPTELEVPILDLYYF